MDKRSGKNIAYIWKGIVIGAFLVICVWAVGRLNVVQRIMQSGDGKVISNTEESTEQSTGQTESDTSFWEMLNNYELVEQMGVGISIGNSLDSVDKKRSGTVEDYETLWGNPLITKKLIHAYKEAGFGTIRLPVTYYDQIEADGVTIREEWLNRVEEIVGWILDEEMYCIIDVHHDTGEGIWIHADMENYDLYEERLTNLWEQIAKRFADYDERLIFEGFNEILNEQDSWTDYSVEDLQAVNQLNQAFVDTVRASGGKNKSRFLVVNTYGAMMNELISENFELPSDTVEGKMIISIHTYAQDEASIDSALGMEYALAQKFDVPGIIGEFGLTGSSITDKEEYVLRFIQIAQKYNLGYIWWDSGSSVEKASDVDGFCLFNRKTAECYFPTLVQMLITGEKTEESVDEDSIQFLDTLDYSSGSEETILDTALEFNEDMEIELQFTYSYPVYKDLISAYTSDNNRVLAVRLEQDVLMEGYGWYNEKVQSLEQGTLYTVRQKDNQIYIDDELLQTGAEQELSVATIQIHVCQSFHYCKIWKAGELVAWYVPVYAEVHDGDWRLGIYDKVREDFVLASGECTAGSVAETQ